GGLQHVGHDDGHRHGDERPGDGAFGHGPGTVFGAGAVDGAAGRCSGPGAGWFRHAGGLPWLAIVDGSTIRRLRTVAGSRAMAIILDRYMSRASSHLQSGARPANYVDQHAPTRPPVHIEASKMPFAPPGVADQVIAALPSDDKGLIPAIAQQHDTGEVLMMAWMNA